MASPHWDKLVRKAAPQTLSTSAKPCDLMGNVIFLELHAFLLVLCADFQLGAEWLPLGGVQLPGSGLKGRSVSLGFDLVHVILRYDHVTLRYDHAILRYDHAVLRYDHIII